MAQSIQGTAIYPDRMALPPGAVFEATLEEVLRHDLPAGTIARTRISPPGRPPIAFTITYDPAKILPHHHYCVRARIFVNQEILFTSWATALVITGGGMMTGGRPTKVSLVLRRAAAAQSGPSNPAGTRPLTGTYWKAIELGGKPTPTQEPTREAHLQFHPIGFVGSDGCTLIGGTYQLEGDLIEFGPLPESQMACLNGGEIARTFREALKSATRLTVLGDRLELFDKTGKRVAVFAAGAEGSVTLPPARFDGTSWQLVKFQGSDGTMLTPDDGAKYIIAFSAAGRLTARVDCNWGRGSWTSTGSNLEFGPLALTRAKCPSGLCTIPPRRQFGQPPTSGRPDFPQNS